MAVGVVLEFPNANQADYDNVSRRLGLSSPNAQWPTGIISHTAGPLEGGGWCVIDEWESREDFQRFYNERLRQALQGTGMESTQPRWFEVYNYYESDIARTGAQRRAA